jgi:hypothetical protein
MWLEGLTSSLLNRMFNSKRSGPVNGVLLGRTLEPPRRNVVWPDRYRCQHAVILGKTGSGKTYLLESIGWRLAQRGEGLAFVDFHGDSSLSLIARLRRLSDAGNRLVILDPAHPTRSAGINILQSEPNEADRFRKVSELSSILRQRWGVDSFGARTEELLRNSLFTLSAGNCTLADFPRFLADSRLRTQLVDRLDHPDVASYWRERYEPLSEAMKGVFREPLLNKVTAFLAEPGTRHLLGQPESTVDIASAMRNAQWLVLRLPKGRLREHAHTLGNLLFAQLQFAALARESVPAAQRSTFTLLCDEAQNLAENDLQTLLTEGRKFGISVVTANQFWEQLPKDLRGALLSARSHICFRISSADAHVIAPELSLAQRSQLPAQLTELDRGEAIGRVQDGRLTRFRVPALPQVHPAGLDELEQLIRPYTRARTEIEATLRGTQTSTPPDPLQSSRGSVEEGQDAW